MRGRMLSALLALMLGAVGAARAGSDLWLHVRVEEGDGGARVAVNLPLEMIERALPLVDRHERIGRHAVHFDGRHLTWTELRELWAEVRSSPDMTFVTVEEDDESVRVWKEQGYLHVEVRERGWRDRDETVDVRMPLPFVDALLSGPEDEIDLQAAVLALAEHGDTELVTVRDEDDYVRVWVDGEPESGE